MENVNYTAFDQMVCGENIQLIKAVLPYLSISDQQMLSVFEKSMELANTISLYRSGNNNLKIQEHPENQDPVSILKDISQYCYGNSKERIMQILDFLTIIQLSQTINDEKNQSV